jgi:hypothetical protein
VPSTRVRSLARITLLTTIASVFCSHASAQSPEPTTIVLWTSSTTSAEVRGEWQQTSDASAAGGTALNLSDLGRTKIVPALTSPSNFVDLHFDAIAGVRYHLWLRMRAEADAWSNDSVHVQFSGAVTSTGAPMARIGTTDSLEPVLQDGATGQLPSGWGWTDNGWGALGTDIFFETSGPQVLRVQQREDGVSVDQIVLSPDTYLSSPPGPRQNDATILPANGAAPAPPPPSADDTIVRWASSASDDAIAGEWTRMTDSAAAGGAALGTPNQDAAKIVPGLANPASYFEVTFPAEAGRPYHVWLRLRAEADSWANDSVHVQFSSALDASGSPYAGIGTTETSEFVLQAGPNGPNPRGWGWADNGWGALGPHVYFASTGTHTLRVQQREDGAIVDQIVISPDAYLTTPPGSRHDDATILPETAGPANQPPTVAITEPADGMSFTAPATIAVSASASDVEGELARVDFFAGSMAIGTVTTAPYSIAWSEVPEGSYTLTAVAVDADGASTTSAPVVVTVTAPPPPPPQTWQVVFNASTDHDTLVSSYLLEIFPAGADPSSATAVASDNLGKPTPNAANEIQLDRSAFFGALAGGDYIATVAAVGDGGQSRSAPFAFTR